ncbi:MAG: hypothetical protein R3Y67_03000 [Eubacteriales bacterium]
MKVKYQLRGFAVGIIITGILMTAMNRVDSEPASDVYILQDSVSEEEYVEGEEEPLVEDTSVEEVNEGLDEEEETIEIEENVDQEMNQELEETLSNHENEDLVILDDTLSTENSQEISTVIDSITEEMVLLQIVGGDSSVTVSSKLFALGLIESATEYDQYLCQYGYDKNIRAGNYEFYTGATYEEIAKAISSN